MKTLHIGHQLKKKLLCLSENLKIIKNALLFYLRNSKKSFSYLSQVKLYIKKNTVCVKVCGSKNEIVRTFRHFSLWASTRASHWTPREVGVYSTPRF